MFFGTIFLIFGLYTQKSKFLDLKFEIQTKFPTGKHSEVWIRKSRLNNVKVRFVYVLNIDHRLNFGCLRNTHWFHPMP